MKIRFFSIIFLCLVDFLSVSRAGGEIIKSSADRIDCYIYVSVSKEKNIVIFKLDPLNEELVLIAKQNLAGTPGSLCIDPSGRTMYAALRDISSIASMKIDNNSGKLVHLKDTPVADNPVYISADKKGKYLFFTSYNGNKNAVYPLENEAVNQNPVQIIDARINPHMIRSDASGRFVFVPNKGGDVVQQFILQPDGTLMPNKPEAISVSRGSGPRHFTINPAGNIMYVVNELSCTVVVFHLDKTTGILTGPFQEITTKPADFTSFNTCADIHITPDGKFLYASNRGHDSLAGFAIDPKTGKLTPLGWFPTEKEPREFEIEPSGKFAIAAGESSGRIALYRIRTDGSLSLLKTYSVGQWPVWVTALELADNAGPTDQKYGLAVTRERADELLAKLPATDPWERVPDGSTLAWGESALLRTLVDLYEATDDPGYLKEVARRGDQLLSHRDDRRGVVDCSGKSRPAWSMGLKFVVAEGQLTDPSGKPVIKIVSTPSSNNDLTLVEVITPSKGTPGRFTIKVSNSYYKRNELFSDLSLNEADSRFIEKIINDPLSPYGARSGDYTDKSNLIRVNVVSSALPVVQEITLKPIPLAYMGYIGIIYDPMLRFAEIVKANPQLKDLVTAADRFILAAEESYADANKRLWRNGPGEGEGYYITCERGESFPADNVGEPFNYLGRHVCSQLALYRLTGKKEYLDRSEKMCIMFRNRLKNDPESDLYIWNYWYEPMTTTGWRPEDSLSLNVGYFAPRVSVEDVSHGVLDIAMVAAAYRAGIVFSKTDLLRFANTLLTNVITPDRTEVRIRVDGGAEHPPYFNALHGWLELSVVNPEVYHTIRQTYFNKGAESLAFCADLLKWERKLK